MFYLPEEIKDIFDIYKRCEEVHKHPHMIALWYVKDGRVYLDRFLNKKFPVLDLGIAVDLLAADLEKVIDQQK